jgi:hypothetical protein
MHSVYSSTATGITPHQLDSPALLAIGRIIRACAELEDLLSLHLCALADISEAQSLILLGKTPVSQRLRIAATLAAGTSQEEAVKTCFDNVHYQAIVRCRNAVAHGVFLGLTDDAKMAFRVAEVIGTAEGRISLLVQSYGQADLEGFAAIAESAVPQVETHLKLSALREKRRQQDLFPHRKAQPTRQPSVKRERPPKASRGSKQPM